MAINKTQFSTAAELNPKFLVPYEVTAVKGNKRYDVEKRYNVLQREQTPHSSTTIFVEGNIGAGKSTLMRWLANFEEIEVFYEPVEDWQNINGHNLLELMYQNPERYAFVFQMYVMISMLQQRSVSSSKKDIRVTERSLASAKHCFVKALVEMNIMDHRAKFFDPTKIDSIFENKSKKSVGTD